MGLAIYIDEKRKIKSLWDNDMQLSNLISIVTHLISYQI
jgi:hypothetical protein